MYAHEEESAAVCLLSSFTFHFIFIKQCLLMNQKPVILPSLNVQCTVGILLYKMPSNKFIGLQSMSVLSPFFCFVLVKISLWFAGRGTFIIQIYHVMLFMYKDPTYQSED